MSFNIRYGTADDGPNVWQHRRELLVETIRAFDPDLLGTQETLAFQRDYLAAHLPGYDYLGAGRNDGREDGEMVLLLYRRERFEKLDGGHFWLSETPERAGSKSWDSSLPRMVTWVKLRDRGVEGANPILFLNAHFDNRGTVAQLQSARLLRTRAMDLGGGCSLIVTGDFNAAAGSAPYEALFGLDGNQPSPLVDAYRVVHSMASANEGTFSGFNVASTSGRRMDWTGVSRDWQILEADIDHTSRQGRTPSDHFPVTAVLRCAAR